MNMKTLLFFIFACANYLSLHAQKGYSGRVELGIGSDYNLVFYTAHGKYIKSNLFVGMGTGLNVPMHNYQRDEKKIGVLIVPLLFEAQYIPLKSVVSPVFSVQLGGENAFFRPWSY